MKFKNILLILLLIITLTACDRGENGNQEDDGITKVALLINGNLGDRSFFDSAHEGIKKINKEFEDIKTTVIEVGQNSSNWEPALRELSESRENYDLIIVGTDQMRERLHRIAPQYPEKRYVIFDSNIYKEAENRSFPNVYSISYKQSEGSFLAGVLAAAWLQDLQPDLDTKISGFVGGLKSDIIKDFAVGYYQGIQYVNELENYKPTRTFSSYVGGFNDSTTGKSQARSQYNNGASILFQAASQSGLGAIDAVSELYKTRGIEKYIIGVDSDQHEYFSTGDTKDIDKANRIVTSVLKRVDLSLYDTIKKFYEGTLEFDQVVYLGLDTIIEDQRIIGLAKNNYYFEIIPEKVRDLIDEVEQKIISGEIIVLSTYDLTLSEFNDIEDSLKVN